MLFRSADQILQTDDFVIGRENVFAQKRQLVVVVRVVRMGIVGNVRCDRRMGVHGLRADTQYAPEVFKKKDANYRENDFAFARAGASSRRGLTLAFSSGI